MYTLKNDRIEIKISEIGAEIRSLKKDGERVLHDGNPEFWSGVAPIMFPVCDGTVDGVIEVDGVRYPMIQHGYARLSEFEIAGESEKSVTFLHTSNEETKKSYPFDYELYITYTLEGCDLEIKYDVVNKSDRTMHFLIGSHEAYACPDGIENYDVIFEKKETLDASIRSGRFIENRTRRILTDSDTLPLLYEYFEIDSLMFKKVKSRNLVLKNRKTGRSIGLKFDGFDYLGFWTKVGAPFICIEPWCGVQHTVGDSPAIEKREGVNHLESGKTFTRTHTIIM